MIRLDLGRRSALGLSLTARLSLLFALSAMALLLGLGWVLARSVEHHLAELDRHEIAGHLGLVRSLLSKAHEPRALAASSVQLQEALGGHPGLALKVEAPDGSVWFSTDGVRAPPAAAGGADPKARWRVWEEDGRWFRGLTLEAATGLPAQPPYRVTIALDIGHHQHFMAGLRQTLALVTGLAVLTAAVLGWAAAHTGLRPLRRLTELAQSLDANRLGVRLPEHRMPAEIAALVRAFNAMLARLEDSFRRLSELAADVAHELRTPVGSLMVQTQVALSKARDPDQYRDVLYSSLEEYERMAQMIADMLFLAQSDNGLMRPKQDAVDLAAEVRDLFEYFDAWAEECGVALALEGRVPILCGDRLMLRRALSNLLANAIRHTAAGRRVRVCLTAGRGEARIVVENPGPRIPAEHLRRLFDRFYCVDPARRRPGECAGLGLAIVKSIVVIHGGVVSVTSNERRTRFLLRLPRAPGRVIRPTAAGQVCPDAGHSERTV